MSYYKDYKRNQRNSNRRSILSRPIMTVGRNVTNRQEENLTTANINSLTGEQLASLLVALTRRSRRYAQGLEIRFLYAQRGLLNRLNSEQSSQLIERMSRLSRPRQITGNNNHQHNL